MIILIGLFASKPYTSLQRFMHDKPYKLCPCVIQKNLEPMKIDKVQQNMLLTFPS
jgi:hypothetical protein